jgi:cytochrome c peroxidase
MKRRLRWLLFGYLCAALAACGGGGSSATTGSSLTTATTAVLPPRPVVPLPIPTASPATATAGGLPPAAAAYLNLDVTALLNYARPALPAYDTLAAVTASDNTPPNNPVTDAGATLGRVLFNDPRLSTTGTIACATCHQQPNGFTSIARFNLGVLGTQASAFHTMRLANVRYYRPGTMFWDKSAASVEAQAIVPIQNMPEMGFDSAHGGLAALETAMSALPYYPPLFQLAFGSPAITTTGIENALAQYERSMISTGSRWDQGFTAIYVPGTPPNFDQPLPNFTATENRGLHLFMASPQAGGVGCAACHQPPTFALNGNSLDNGLDAGQTTVFKAPSLKNDGHGFFMHDGRFSSLAQVVTHYDSGIQPGPALDPRLKAPNGTPMQLHLSAADQAALVAFLQTLDDPAIDSDPRFANPFIK